MTLTIMGLAATDERYAWASLLFLVLSLVCLILATLEPMCIQDLEVDPPCPYVELSRDCPL